MEAVKKEILEKHCYTELVYGRINKKLGANFSKSESEKLIKKTLFIISSFQDSPSKSFSPISSLLNPGNSNDYSETMRKNIYDTHNFMVIFNIYIMQHTIINKRLMEVHKKGVEGPPFEFS